MQSVPWHPGVFKVKLELVVFLLAMAGITPIARRKPFILVWFFISLGFLLVWPTKWPQYVLILLTPAGLDGCRGLSLCHLAAPGSLVAANLG